MNRISRRLAFTFISQIVFVLVALAIGTIIFLVYVGLQLESKPETQHVTSRSNSTLRQTFSIENGHVSLDANKISDIEKREEWLQIIDAHGNMLASSKLPSDVPTHYEAGQLIAFWQKSIPFPYELIISQEEKGGQTYFVVVGQKRPARQLAEKLPIEWDGKRLSARGAAIGRNSRNASHLFSEWGDPPTIRACGKSSSKTFTRSFTWG